MTEPTASETPAEPTIEEIAEQKAVRLGKRERLIAEGGDAYPVRLPITATIPEVRARFGELEADATTGLKTIQSQIDAAKASKAKKVKP